MNPEEMSAGIDIAQVVGQAGGQATLGSAAQVYLEEQNRALAEKQLDVKNMRKECYYILKEYTWNPDEATEWTVNEPKKRVLTDWGVNRIMQIIHFYINQNNLLSNFKEEEVCYLMNRFLSELNDLFLLKYEFLFKEPTFEDCKAILLERLDQKKKLRVFSYEILGKKMNVEQEEQVRKEILQEVETRIVYEMEKIKKEQRKERLREFAMIIAQLEVIVLGALNRALNGEERGSLRRHTQMLEMLGATTQQAKEGGGLFKSVFGR